MTRRDFIQITTKKDPRIADYVCVRERDLTGREGKFIVEGKVTLEVFLRRSRFAVDSLFLETSRVEVLSDLLSTLPGHVPVYTAAQEVMDEIVGFPIHRGVLACGRKQTLPAFADWLSAREETRTLVLCVGLSNHDNVGAVFRNAAALGADGVALDETSCDPLYRKSIRVSAGTALWLPFYHGCSAEALMSGLEANGYTLWTLTPGTDATPLYEAVRPERACIVLGPEGPGLSPELIARGKAINIPMSHDVDSLNVATSLAIALSWRFSG